MPTGLHASPETGPAIHAASRGRRIAARLAPVAIIALALGGALTGVSPASRADAGSQPGSTASVAAPGAPARQASALKRLAEARGSTAGAQGAGASAGAASFSPAQRAAIERIVRDYLVRNPEILIEVQTALEAKAHAFRQARMREALSKHARALFSDPSDPVMGNPKGDVTVVEFFDYNCGFCRRAITDVSKLIAKDKNIKFVFKELPIFGRESVEAARVALAARKQGKYWPVHRALLEKPGRANEAKALRIAKSLGLDMARLKKDMASPEVAKIIADTQKLAQQLGINGTPHFFIGDKVIPGAPENLLEELTQKVAEVRKNGCAVC